MSSNYVTNSLLEQYLRKAPKVGNSAYRNLQPQGVPQNSDVAQNALLQEYYNQQQEPLTTTEVNKTLKDPKAARAILEQVDPGAAKKVDKKDDKMNVLQRVGEVLSFDEWSDDVVWAMQQYRNQETGDRTPVKGVLSTIGLPLKYAESGVRKVAGGVVGSKKLSGYDNPRGRDIIPQMMANMKMNTEEGKQMVAEKGRALSYEDFDELLGDASKGGKIAANLGTGAVGLLADTVGTPSFWLSHSLSAAAKGAKKGTKVIKEGLKNPLDLFKAGQLGFKDIGVEDLAKNLAEQGVKNPEGIAKSLQEAFNMGAKNIYQLGEKRAMELARQAIEAVGGKATTKNIHSVIKSSRHLTDVAKEVTPKGLYVVGPLTKNAKLLWGGEVAEKVAKYIDNPIFAAVGDAWKPLSKIPTDFNAGTGETISTVGSTFDDIMDVVKDKLVPRHLLRRMGGEDMVAYYENTRVGLRGADTMTRVEAQKVQEGLDALEGLKDIPGFSDPYNNLTIREFITGNVQRTQFDTFVRGIPGMTDKQVDHLWDLISKTNGEGKKVKEEIARQVEQMGPLFEANARASAAGKMAGRVGSAKVDEFADKVANHFLATELDEGKDVPLELFQKEQGEMDGVFREISEAIQKGDMKKADLIDSINKSNILPYKFNEEILNDFLPKVEAKGRVLSVVGSRSLKDKESVFKALDRAHASNPISKIVSGGADGPDKFAAEWAKKNGVELQEYIPDWSKGKGAGLARNTDIVNDGDEVMAFWDGKSKGTLDSITKAEKAGKKVFKPFGTGEIVDQAEMWNIAKKELDITDNLDVPAIETPYGILSNNKFYTPEDAEFPVVQHSVGYEMNEYGELWKRSSDLDALDAPSASLATELGEVTPKNQFHAKALEQEQGLNALREQVKTLKPTVEEAKGTIKSIDDEIGELDFTLNQLETARSATESKIRTLKEQQFEVAKKAGLKPGKLWDEYVPGKGAKEDLMVIRNKMQEVQAEMDALIKDRNVATQKVMDYESIIEQGKQLKSEYTKSLGDSADFEEIRAKDIADLSKVVHPKVAELAVDNPEKYRRVLANEIKLRDLKREWLDKKTEKIHQRMIDKWYSDHPGARDVTAPKDVLAKVDPDGTKTAEEIQKLLDFEPGGFKYRDFHPAELSKGFEVEMNPIATELSSDAHLESMKIGTRGRYDKFIDPGYMESIQGHLEKTWGYVDEGNVKSVKETLSKELDKAKEGLEAMRAAKLSNEVIEQAQSEFEFLEDVYTYVHLTDKMKWYNYKEALTGFQKYGTQTDEFLTGIITRPYYHSGYANTMELESMYRHADSNFERFVEQKVGDPFTNSVPYEKAGTDPFNDRLLFNKERRAAELIEHYRTQKRSGLAKKIFDSHVQAYKKGGDTWFDKKMLPAMEAQELLEKVEKSIPIETGGVPTEAEEMLGAILGKDTNVMDINLDELEKLFDDIGFKGPGRQRILTAMVAYQESAAQSKKFVDDFANWLAQSPLPGHKKDEIAQALAAIQENYNVDMTVDVVREKVARDLIRIEKLVDDMAGFDSQSAKMAEYFKKTLIEPMRSYSENYMLRDRMPGFKNISTYGVGSKTMDLKANPPSEVVSKFGYKERKLFNDATIAAYNAVLGEEHYKTVDRLETFVHDVVGKQAMDNNRLSVIHKNMSAMLEDIAEGKLGDNILINDGTVKLDPSEWKKVDIPILKEAEVWARHKVANELESLTHWYFKPEGTKDLLAGIHEFNNIWKGVQTGAGVDLPKIKGAALKAAQDAGLGKFADYYNENLSFVSLSPAFTFRNVFTGNYPSIRIGTDMSHKEVIEYLNKAVDGQKDYLRKLGAKEYSQGLFGALSSKEAADYISTRADEFLLSGIVDQSYRKSAFGGVEEAATPLGRIMAKTSEGMVGGRSMDFNENMENLWKMALFMYERDSGKSIEDAAATVQRVLFDYSDVTAFERDIIKPWTVFYTWTRKNIELMYETAKNRPQAFRTYAKILTEPGQQFGSREDREKLPEWTQEKAGIPFQFGDQTLFAHGWGGGLESAGELLGNGPLDAVRNVIDMQAPATKIPLNLALGTNTYKGMDIEDDTSAYSYRNLPEPLKNFLGIKQRDWQDREGNSGSTYTMDGRKKYMIESLLGRAATVPAKWMTVASESEDRGKNTVDLLTGMKLGKYDTDYLDYQSDKSEYEDLMEQLVELGIVTQYAGYGYNSKGAELNYPLIEQYIRGAQ